MERNNQYLAYLLTFLFFCFSGISSAQQHFFKQFNVEDGLSQNYIYSITQDGDGALLIATGEGLVRYNGNRFQAIPADSILQNSFVTASFHASNNQVYFGHFNGEISVYKNDSLKLVSTNVGGKVQRIKADEFGRLLFLRQQANITCYDMDKDEWQETNIQSSGMTLNDFMELEEDRYIFGGSEGLYLAAKDGEQCVLVDSSLVLKNKNVIKIIERTPEQLWIFTQYNGIYTLDVTNDNSVDFNSVKPLKYNGNIEVDIQTALQDFRGDVWLGTAENGLLKMSTSRGSIALERYTFSSESKSVFIRSLFQDREGTLWIGSYGKGLFQRTERVLQPLNVEVNGATKDVRALIELDRETMLLGTSKGLYRVRFDASGFKNFIPIDALEGKSVTSLIRSSNDSIWIGTLSNGVYLMNSNGVVKRDERTADLDQKRINHLNVDEEKNVWISTATEGVILLTSQGERNDFNTLNGLPHNQVIMTHIDLENRMWFATFGGGLAAYKNGGFRIYDNKDGLQAHNFNSITSDKEGKLWIGTYGTGVYEFSNVQFNPFSINTELLSKYCYLSICDDENNIWIGSRAGFSKIDNTRKRVFNYPLDGFEVNINAAIKSANGDLWFGTNNGVVRHSSNNYQFNTVPPTTNMQLLIVDKDTIDLNQESPSWSYGNFGIQFVLEGLSLKNPENVRYRYKLMGYEEEWSSPQASNTIKFNNLREGDYELQYQSTNNDGVWGEMKAYAFIIKPPFWRTWWFLSALVVVLLTVFIVAVRWREKSLKDSNRKLELMVAQRTAEVVHQKDVITRKNKDIQDSINYASRIQQAILSDLDLKHNLIDEIFVLYKPKDVVSGDFYWIREEAHRIVIAAGDCTGHGVPGAFMSIIGENGLRRAVQDRHLQEPARILDSLNQFVIHTLSQSNEERLISDGMDITVCTIDKTGFQFAGAKNPLYIYENGKILEIKGDRHAVGEMDDNVMPYANHEFQRKKGQMIYLFSDGLADQFGGSQDKKFMYKQFKELLIAVAELPAEEQQKRIEEAFISWKGDNEQIDDVLVVGIRL